MGREIKRVPAGFDHPLGQVWPGYLHPDHLTETPCEPCNGTGRSSHARTLTDLWYGRLPFDPADTGSTPLTPEHPIIRDRAERNIAHSPGFYGTGPHVTETEAARLARHYNSAWMHHLTQEDTDALIAAGRLHDLTSIYTPGKGWVPYDPPRTITAAQVNAWSLTGFGHDSINWHIVIKARCERDGQPLTCHACDGHGSTETYPGQREDAENWEPEEPPAGDAWQLWETTSEGSPISPAFATAEELATWISDPARDRYIWMAYPAAMQFINVGWAPTFIATPGTGLVSGAEYIGMHDDPPAAT